jgi:phosphoglycolate phosphatase-like HAD superfamily hydrolase
VETIPSIKDAARKLCEGIERGGHTGKILVTYDFDGTLLDTMGEHGDLAADVMHEEFGTVQNYAKVLYYSTTGIPFPAQLEKIYPERAKIARARCAKRYSARKTDEVYRAAEPFFEVEEALQAVSKMGHFQTIASSTEAWLIKELTDRHGITGYFETIWGCGEGSKSEHIAHMRKHFELAGVIFVGDSASDVKMNQKGADLAIGKAGSLEKGMLNPGQLVNNGADYASEDLRDVGKILNELGALYAHTATG